MAQFNLLKSLWASRWFIPTDRQVDFKHWQKKEEEKSLKDSVTISSECSEWSKATGWDANKECFCSFFFFSCTSLVKQSRTLQSLNCYMSQVPAWEGCLRMGKHHTCPWIAKPNLVFAPSVNCQVTMADIMENSPVVCHVHTLTRLQNTNCISASQYIPVFLIEGNRTVFIYNLALAFNYFRFMYWSITDFHVGGKSRFYWAVLISQSEHSNTLNQLTIHYQAKRSQTDYPEGCSQSVPIPDKVALLLVVSKGFLERQRWAQLVLDPEVLWIKPAGVCMAFMTQVAAPSSPKATVLSLTQRLNAKLCHSITEIGNTHLVKELVYKMQQVLRPNFF